MNDRPWRILIVDDDPLDISMMEVVLKDGGLSFTLEVCQDGDQASRYFALRTAEKPLPDLVLLDLNMPRKSGHEVLSELRADPLTKNLPVIILTTEASPEDISALNAFRNTAWFVKPFVVKEYGRLLDLIRRTLAVPAPRY